jgi:MFS family permease
MVYPTLLAAVGDVAHPGWRASSVGVYRLWRDGGFAVGALVAGVVADLFGLAAAIWVVAAITAVSGLVVAVRMYETHPRDGRDESTPPDSYITDLLTGGPRSIGYALGWGHAHPPWKR